MALCKRERGCFKLYHDLVFGGINEANQSPAGIGSKVNLKQFIVKPPGGVSPANVSLSNVSNTSPYSKYSLSQHVAQSNAFSTPQSVSSSLPTNSNTRPIIQHSLFPTSNSNVVACHEFQKLEYHHMPSSSVDVTGQNRQDEPLALTVSTHASSGHMTTNASHWIESSSHVTVSPDTMMSDSDHMTADSGQEAIVSSQDASDCEQTSENSGEVTGSSDQVTGESSYVYGSVVFPSRNFRPERIDEEN